MDKSTGKELLVDGKTIESSVSVNPTTSCGSAVMNFNLNTAELGGKEIVVFERMYEKRSDGNYDGVEPTQKHEDIDDSKQTIRVISLGTTAKDGTDDDKEILATKGAVIKDMISYCVKPGQKYTIRGILMNKATGEPLVVDGNKIEGSMEIEPTEACGTADMFFHFDATGLQGTEIVVFEKLYIFGDDAKGKNPIITHEDINDPAQATIVYLPPPNTGHFTNESGDSQTIAIVMVSASVVLTAGGYGIYRMFARRRFFNR